MRFAFTMLVITASGLPVTASAGTRAKSLPPCTGIDVGRSGNALPFAIGEELSYELKAAGVYVGRMDMKVGRPRSINGRKVLTLFSRAHTNTFASKFQAFEGRYMAFVDPQSLHPVALRTQTKFGKDQRWERARFEGDSNAVRAAFRLKGNTGKRAYDNRAGPLLDLLSVFYFARTRTLDAGTVACQELYADRRVWRMEGRVRGRETIETRAGRRKVFAIEARLERVPHRDFNPKRKRPWIELEIYVSDTPDRIPLAFTAQNSRGIKGRGDLTRWSRRAKSEDVAWSF